MTEGAIEQPVFDYDAALTIIQNGTPEGFKWKLKVEGEFGYNSLIITLHRDAWNSWFLARYQKSYSIGDDTTPESFREGVLVAAIKLLEDRMDRLSRLYKDDWAKLAQELQAALNGK